MFKKQFVISLITILILSFAIAQINIKQVFSLNNNNDTFSAPHQTIPTRTPTPGANPPTKTPAPKPTSSGGDDDPATAVPTSTTQSSPTDTATPPVTIAFTPVGGFVPTAESCSSQPTIKAQNSTNVRQGPGTNYPVVGQLVFLEVRFILGRAADAAWWLIQLDDGDTGWVADNIVTVQGYIGGVPIMPAPEINGNTPTPGTPWNPTPLPFCTVTPTATAVPSATPSPTTAVTESTPVPPDAEVMAEAADSVSQTTAESALPTEMQTPPPTQTAVAPPTLPPAPATSQPEVINAVQASVDPVEAAPSGSAADWLLPAAGLLLIAGGAVTFVTRRKN
jgi:hypothetical protein